MKTRKLTAWIGTAITSLIVVVSSQSVNLLPAAFQTSARSLVKLGDLYPEGELVYNGGFSLDPFSDPDNPKKPNPNITGWTKSGNPLDTTIIQLINYPHSGTQALSLFGFIDLSYISQNISTTPGKYYQLTYWLAAGNYIATGDNEFQALVGGNIVFDQKDILPQQYKQYQLTFQAQDYSTELKFGSINKKGFFALDDVSVKEVEAPPTLKRW